MLMKLYYKKKVSLNVLKMMKTLYGEAAGAGEARAEGSQVELLPDTLLRAHTHFPSPPPPRSHPACGRQGPKQKP